MKQTIEDIYQRHLKRKTAITDHLPRLRDLAKGCETVVELGVKHGASSSAFLLEADRVISYDIAPTPDARRLQEVAGDRWCYRIEDSRTAKPEPCELLFIDSLHTYEQMRMELNRHAPSAEGMIVFHDVTTFGEIGADGETGRHSWQYIVGESVPVEHMGIRPSIDELMIRDRSWRILKRYTDSHGLLVLSRV